MTEKETLSENIQTLLSQGWGNISTLRVVRRMISHHPPAEGEEVQNGDKPRLVANIQRLLDGATEEQVYLIYRFMRGLLRG